VSDRVRPRLTLWPEEGYLDEASDLIALLVKGETQRALSQLESIASVEGIDGVFIGRSGLAASLGHIGEERLGASRAGKVGSWNDAPDRDLGRRPSPSSGPNSPGQREPSAPQRDLLRLPPPSGEARSLHLFACTNPPLAVELWS